MNIQTDHRPLVKLLGDRTLDEIDNRRLINLNGGLVLGGEVPPPARKNCDFAGERGKRGKNPSTSVPNYWMGFYL